MGLFGNLFDFDGDGEEDFIETMLGINRVSSLFEDEDKYNDDKKNRDDKDDDDWLFR